MSKTVSRAAIDTLLPPGALWQPELDEGFDQQLDGIGDTTDSIRETLDTLADIRNPLKTPVFEDLERNYGIKPNVNVLQSIRISRLSQKVFQGEKVNSGEDLQAELITAGFDLQVHRNDPPVDPNLFLTQAFQITAGSDFAFAGYNNGVDILAFAASLGGVLLVNTPIFLQSNAFEMQAGGDIAYAGFNYLANVTLDGATSYDPDNNVLNYHWNWTIDSNTYEGNTVNPFINSTSNVGIARLTLRLY